MKKRIIFCVLLLLLIFCSGCHKKDEAVTANKKILMDRYGFSYEDLDRIDIGDFLRDNYDILIDSVVDKSVAYELLEEYKADMANDITYLFNNDETTGELRDLSVKCFALWINDGNQVSTIIYDCQKNLIYYNKYADIFRYYDKKETIEMSENDLNNINSLVNQYLSGWDKEYNGSNRGTTGSFSWKIAIEFSDYTLYRFSGNGMYNGKPDDFNALKQMVWSAVD